MFLHNREELQNLRKEAEERLHAAKLRVLVCAGTGCIASGSKEIYDKMKELSEGNGQVSVEFGGEVPHPEIRKSGCHGFCEMGPLMRIEPLGILYIKVKVEDCEEIYEKTICQGQPIERLLYHKDGQVYQSEEAIPFYAGQMRLVLKNCGHIDAENIEEYIAVGGYSALEKVLFDIDKETALDMMEESGLRGRGGGGFPAGRKWKQVARQKETQRYVVCNGDEGDPGAFMDRSIMEGDPHKMLEGMLIGSYLTGAQNAYIYVRAEYPLAVERLQKAIAQAEEYGLIGDNVLGTDFCIHFHINRGAGAFVCGEGSALTASIEGKRGMPRVKPPRTVEQGLFAKPTVLNNVETYANVPMIITNGVEWYRSIGTEGSPGTKAFALTGNVNNTGLIEVPMGTTLRTIIYDIGGGLKGGGKFKGVQIGGPSGGCLVEENLDVPLDFDQVKKYNAIIGSGGLVVMDESTCMVDVAKFFMGFTQRESCGKCGPCRIGTKRMLELLEKITDGKGEMEDLDKLEETAKFIQARSLCGLGKSAPLPVLSTLKNFRDEYIEHIVEGKCRAHVCEAMKVYEIDPEKCKGCTKCARNCPVGAIAGEKKQPHKIDPSKCIKCGSCMDNCPFGAIGVK